MPSKGVKFQRLVDDDSRDPLPSPASAVDADETPPPASPTLILIVSYAIVCSDAVALTVIVPFIVDICITQFGISKDKAGMAAGGLTGIQSFSQFVCSFFLGHLSDIYGRKSLLLLGLATGCLSLVGISLSTSYWLALFCRFIGGVTNANISLAKALITDVTADPNTRAIAFAYQGTLIQIAILFLHRRKRQSCTVACLIS
jgi:MFS family permease